jgi:hypothetical protein
MIAAARPPVAVLPDSIATFRAPHAWFFPDSS